MAFLQIKYTYTGPRCYNSNHIEKLWANLKDRDLNPENLPTGKK